MVLIYILNIYEDSYSVHINGKLAKTNSLCITTKGIIKQIISEFNQLKDSYCQTVGSDIVYYRLNIGDRSVNLGTFSSNCFLFF